MRNIKNIFFTALLVLYFSFGFSGEALAGGTLSASDCSNNCQNIINAALSTGGTTYLQAGTYVISSNINITVDGTTLTGDNSAVIKLINNANWPADENGGMIQAKSGVNDVRITGFEIDGNGPNNTTSGGISTVCGKYYYTMIYFKGGSGIEVDNMKLHDNWNDILKLSQCNDVKFHDNIVRSPGHDIVYASRSEDIRIYNNYMRIYCNSGARGYYVDNFYVYNNDIARESAGANAAIELQGGAPDGGASQVYVCDNIYGSLKCIYDLENGVCWPGLPPNAPFDGVIHTEGCSGSYSPIPNGSSAGGSGSAGGAGSSTPGYSTNFESGLPDGASGNSNSPGSSEYSIDPLYEGPGYAPGTATGACTDVDDSAGLVPCGKAINDPETTWSECAPCDACSVVLMTQLVIEFAVKMAGIIATIVIVIAGFMHIVAAGKPKYLSVSNSMIKGAVVGFIIVFTAWLLVDTILTTMGYIDPVDGVWYTVC
ncbi:MAG: glycosyl hydrolase family 28 protein [Candidatus Pacebacteria bacterium]|nr:glycosyl hydrolase family 28 protein [Candidatus Paceibacterota bacterium]